jgi:hypothetical protein
MDLEKAIRDLLAERDRISGIIAQLELMQKRETASPVRTQKQRGRKSMSDEERAIVSNRMRQYWESRRKSKNGQSEATA